MSVESQEKAEMVQIALTNEEIEEVQKAVHSNEICGVRRRQMMQKGDTTLHQKSWERFKDGILSLSLTSDIRTIHLRISILQSSIRIISTLISNPTLSAAALAFPIDVVLF